MIYPVKFKTRLALAKTVVLCGVALNLGAPSASAQLTIQSNPVFSTPLPDEQPLGPKKPQPVESPVLFVDDTGENKE